MNLRSVISLTVGCLIGLLPASALQTSAGESVANGAPDAKLTPLKTLSFEHKFPDPQNKGGVISQPAEVSAVAFSPDGELLAVASRTQFDPKTRTTAWRVDVFETARWERAAEPLKFPVTEQPRQLAFHPDGSLLVSAFGYRVSQWDLKNNKLIREFHPYEGDLPVHLNGFRHIAISPDGQLVAAQAYTNKRGQRPSDVLGVVIWECSTGKEVAYLRDPDNDWGDALDNLRPWPVKFSDTGSTLLVTGPVVRGRDGPRLPARTQLRVWDLSDKTLAHTMELGGVCSNVRSPDGRYLIAYEDHETPHGTRSRHSVFELATGAHVQDLPIYPTAFSSDGASVLGIDAVDERLQLTVWSLRSGKLKASWDWPGRYHSMAVSHGKGLVAISGGADGLVSIFSLPMGGVIEKIDNRRLTDEELSKCFETLSTAKASEVWASIWKMVGSPDTTVPFLAERVRPRNDIKAEVINQLFKDLESEDLETRKKAAAHFEKLGPAVRPFLKEHLKIGNPSADAKKNIESILAAILKQIPNADTLRILRANEVLERIGSGEAKKVLEKIAAGDPAARETEDAKEALKRLERRGKVKQE